MQCDQKSSTPYPRDCNMQRQAKVKVEVKAAQSSKGLSSQPFDSRCSLRARKARETWTRDVRNYLSVMKPILRRLGSGWNISFLITSNSEQMALSWVPNILSISINFCSSSLQALLLLLMQQLACRKHELRNAFTGYCGYAMNRIFRDFF